MKMAEQEQATENIQQNNKEMMTEGINMDELSSCCKEPEPATKDFFMHHASYRIKDPKKSMNFYTRVLGMRLLQTMDVPDLKLTVYFMGFHDTADIPEDGADRTRWTFARKPCLELMYNYGTEKDPEQSYHSGNTKPEGYGHVGICVPDVDAACARFKELGVEFAKDPDEGRLKGIAFVKDPDGYWFEIFSVENIVNAC